VYTVSVPSALDNPRRSTRPLTTSALESHGVEADRTMRSPLVIGPADGG